MKIEAPHIANLFNYASCKGISEGILRDCLTEKNLDVCNSNNVVSESEFLNVLKTLMNETSDVDFGIHYGCYLNIKALGFIAQLSLNTLSIQQAVYILQHYLQNSFPLVLLEDVEENGKYILKLVSSIEDVTLKKQILDVVYCFIFRELKLMVSNELLPILEIPNSNTVEFSKCLNAEVIKGKDYSFVFEVDVLTAHINIKRAKEIQLLLPKFLQMLDKKNQNTKYFQFRLEIWF